ncbi:MAG: transcription termination/antitermination protein NusA [Bacteroidia bacterium]|nr:transcription termination/antitermination protein NusA [Bacteroidia bacterium]
MKKTQIKTDHTELVEAFSEFKDLKNIDRASMMSILEDVFKNMLKKKYGNADNFDIVINTDKGDLQALRNRLIVEDTSLEDPSTQIGYSEAIRIQPDFEVGEEVSEEVRFSDFGRRAVLAARQNLMARVQELEKEGIFRKYKDRIGEIVTCEVYQTWKKETLVMDDDGNELILPKGEQIPSDFFKKGDSVRAVVLRVEMINGTPKIILSRTSPLFLEKLFEMEVPEVFDGLITIKRIVREPGERAKVAVESYDDRIDPVGACVGMKGSRIHGIVRELRNENIDVINFTNNTPLFISRALAPAKITSIKLDDESKRASVFLKPDQVSLAIGKGGHNIKLAGKLTGYEIDVYRDTDDDSEDVDLDEFADEIEPWIIDELKNIGCDTAKSVLELPVEDLVKRTDLEEETIKEVIRILKSEFE